MPDFSLEMQLERLPKELREAAVKQAIRLLEVSVNTALMSLANSSATANEMLSAVSMKELTNQKELTVNLKPGDAEYLREVFRPELEKQTPTVNLKGE